MASVTNKEILGAIQQLRDDDLADIKAKLDLLNGRQRETEQGIASLMTWRKVADEEIKGLRQKTNIGAIVLSLGQVLMAAIGAILFRGDGQP